jgi:phosphoribosylanthranilate isomerase
MTRIKICGISTEEHALAAAKAGADFIGLVFAQSPRQVNVSQARKITRTLKENGHNVQTVGVFVNTPLATIISIAGRLHLDWVQLSGDEPPAFCRELQMPVIKVIRVSRNYHPENIIEHIAYADRLLSGQEHMFLLDSNARKKYGGTGMTFDWNLARPVAERFPIIVAGGLTPENVAEAISIIKPWGVDVSSGVEKVRGTKDIEKVRSFISSVRGKA